MPFLPIVKISGSIPHPSSNLHFVRKAAVGIGNRPCTEVPLLGSLVYKIFQGVNGTSHISAQPSVPNEETDTILQASKTPSNVENRRSYR